MKNIIRFYILLCSVCISIYTNAQTQQKENISVTENGNFVLGCNYWASHAGTEMWKDWSPDVVEADLKQISESGMRVIRVFPLWPDFQPIVLYYKAGGSLKEVRFKDGPLPLSGPGKDGLDEKPFSMGAPGKLNLVAKEAKVLAAEKDGNPIFTV